MAADRESIILDVQIDGTQAVQKIAELKGEVANLREEQKKLDMTTEEGRKEYVALDEQIKVINKEISAYSKKIQDTVKENENAADSYNALSAQLAQLKAAYKAAANDQDREAILKNLTKVDQRLKELDEKQGVYVRNVGNYKGAILGAFSALPGPIGAAATQVGIFGNAMKAASATPLIAVLGILLPILQKLIDTFKGNAAAVESTNAAFAAFSGIGVIVDKVVDAVAKAIGWLAEKLGDLAKKIGFVKDEMELSQKLTRDEIELQKKRREAVVENAKAEQQIAKLKADAADKEHKSINQRIAAYKKVAQLEKEKMQRDLDIAQREYDLIKAQNARSESTQEDMMKEAEAEAKLIQVQTNLYNKEKEINSQLSAMAQEKAAAAAKAEATETKKAAQEDKALKEKQKLSKSELDLEIAKYETEVGVVGKYTQESYDRHIKYYDDLAALYEKDSAEYNAALVAKEKYQQDFNKQVEARAAQHDSILAKYNLISGKDKDMQDQLKALQDALDAAIISEEEYAQAVAEIYSQIALDKAASITDMASQVLGIIDTIAGAVEEQENAQLEQYLADNEAKKEALKDRLDSGLISQEMYDEQVNRINAESDKKKKDLELKQAKREKAMAIMNATLAAAQAIIQSLALSPVALGPIPNPVGIASLALATATGTAQVAAAAATPLPKAGKGMLITGPSHAQGGTLIEAEGGEAIINKRATSRYLPILSRINQSTGGIPLYGSGGIVGQSQIDAAQQSASFGDQLSKMKMYVAVTDINDGQNKYAEVEQLREF